MDVNMSMAKEGRRGCPPREEEQTILALPSCAASMRSAGVSVLYAGTTRLYPRPYVPRSTPTKQDQKAPQQSSAPFANLDRFLSSNTASLQQDTLPAHRWECNATASPSGTPHSVLLAQQSLVAIYFANRLQVFNTTTSTRLFEFVFESENGETKVCTPIHPSSHMLNPEGDTCSEPHRKFTSPRFLHLLSA